MTPYAAQITLKKSTQTDQNGGHVFPSPPLLYLLQQDHQEMINLKEEKTHIEDTSQMLKTKNESLANVNAVEAFDEAS